MRHSILAATWGFALILGCAPGQVMNGTGEEAQWQATLQPVAGFAGASASATVMALDWGTTADLRVEDAEPEGRHAWHIHRGECGTDGEIVGDSESYPPVMIGEDGRGESTALLDAALEPGESYYVDLHPTAGDTDTVLACGELESAWQPRDEWEERER